MEILTKTRLHQMGYRKSKFGDFYWKRRYVKVRPESTTTVQVQFRGHGWFDVTSIASNQIDTSIMLKGVRQLKQWESFAFCL